MLRTGVVAALVGGSLAVTAAPALADAPTVTITQLSSTTLTAGQSANLRYQIQNNLVNGPQQVSVRVNVSSNNLSCSGACGSVQTIQNSDEFTATLRASTNLAPGSNQTVTISITAENRDGTSQPARTQLTLKGPDAPKAVNSVSGKVVNVTNGRGIADAFVALNDENGHRFDTQTNDDGSFKFTSTANKPIAPGQLLLAAGKDGFQNNQTSTNVAAGESKSGLRITLRSTASPSASASAASPTAEETTDTPTDEATTEESVDPAAAGDNQNSDSGGTFSWVLIILGGLLVALGVGAIVLLVIRRKDDGEDGAGDGLPGPNGPRPTPGAQGVYRGGPSPTMVTGGAAMGGGPTMAMGPGLNDAPTMMHQPLDEYGDPYGTPLRAPQPTSGPPPATQPGYGYQGGYGQDGNPAGPSSPGAPTAYGSASPTAYGSATPTGRASASASPPDPYSARDYPPPAPQGGYGYDEPTGRYDPNGGYGQASGGYGASGGYEQSGSANGYDGGGYGSGNGYGQQDNGYAPGGGYDSSPNGGYDGGRYQGSAPSGYGQQGAGYEGYGPQGGYPPHEQGGQDGYDRRPGYDRVPEPRPGGYDQQPRGYDQGYYDEPPAERGDRNGRSSSRRSLDWLDD
jgi:hypothetical protein